MDQRKSQLCFGMLQMIFTASDGRRSFRLTLPFLAAAILVSGCMPAKRVSSSQNPASVRSSRMALESVLHDGQLETRQRRLLIASNEWLGTPYSYGGTGTNGIDCSAFVRAVYSTAGVELPRTSVQQADIGREIPVSAIIPGDLLFFNTTGSGVSHVGISIGGTEFIHASSSRGVTVSSLNEQYYRDRVLFARRIDW